MVQDPESGGKEVIEKEATRQGNGAHVLVPKSWSGATVKAIRMNHPRCHVCNRREAETSEWVWFDDGGGASFSICLDCIYRLGEYDGDKCAICQENEGGKKSEGFSPMAHSWNNTGCDACRKAVVFDEDGSDRIAWDPEDYYGV